MKYLQRIGVSFIGISIILIVLSFSPNNLFLPRWAGLEGSSSLSPGRADGPSVYLYWGSYVKGWIYVEGGDKDVYFYIEDSSGTRVFNPGRVYSGHIFVWRAPKNDMYRFYTDNSMSIITSKSVDWLYEIYHYSLPFLVLGIVLLVSGSIMTLKDPLEEWSRQRKAEETKKAERVEKPPTIICTNCGAENPISSIFCGRCGARMGEGESEEMAILRMRLLRGEITKEEYNRLRKILEEKD